MIKKIF